MFNQPLKFTPSSYIRPVDNQSWRSPETQITDLSLPGSPHLPSFFSTTPSNFLLKDLDDLEEDVQNEDDNDFMGINGGIVGDDIHSEHNN